jgi:hypothetical protein
MTAWFASQFFINILHSRRKFLFFGEITKITCPRKSCRIRTPLRFRTDHFVTAVYQPSCNSWYSIWLPTLLPFVALERFTNPPQGLPQFNIRSTRTGCQDQFRVICVLSNGGLVLFACLLRSFEGAGKLAARIFRALLPPKCRPRPTDGCAY